MDGLFTGFAVGLIAALVGILVFKAKRGGRPRRAPPDTRREAGRFRKRSLGAGSFRD